MNAPFFKRNFILIACADAALFAAAWIVSVLLHFNFRASGEIMDRARDLTVPFLAVQMLTFSIFGLYKGMWRYVSIDDLIGIIRAAAASSAIIFFLFVFPSGQTGFTRSLLVIHCVLTILFISGFRLSVRLFFVTAAGKEPFRITMARIFSFRKQKRDDLKNLLIIGAGGFGEKIFREIRDNADLRYRVVGFVDDDQAKIGLQIHNTPVMGPIYAIKAIAERLGAGEALIAISSATSEQMRAVVSHCEESGIPFKTLPRMGELIGGKVTVNSIRHVDYGDLLGREIVRVDEGCIGGYLENSRVMVTGAGGSVGSELCRQICRFNPSRLVLYERAESSLYETDLELKNNFPGIDIVPTLADIRDRERLSRTFEAHRPDVVFHAAAYKHVPMLEQHPWEAVTNNIIGTRNLVDVSAEFSVGRFVLVSTDKAVRPANVMGASKRAAETIVQARQGSCKTRFMAVRFGNVIGSAGSVVPLFKKQIEKGGPVTVTHPEVIRYFMTIPEAAQLILQAGGMGKGGEIFVLDMGKPVRIADMASDLIRLSGFEPGVDIKLEFIGMRPGEKLYEELITEGENVSSTSHRKIMALRRKSPDTQDIGDLTNEIEKSARAFDSHGIETILKKIVPEYGAK